MTSQQLLDAALDMDPREREWLVEQLTESLVGEKQFASDEIERAWLAELQRRNAALDAGTAELVDWSGARSQIAARRAQR
jgi:hypothetical protein